MKNSKIPVEDLAEEEEELSRGARQAAFWQKLVEGEKPRWRPDYIKDGFGIGCVECSSSWDDDEEPEVVDENPDVENCDERYEEDPVGALVQATTPTWNRHQACPPGRARVQPC